MRMPKFYEQAQPREKVLLGLLFVVLTGAGVSYLYDYLGPESQSAAPAVQVYNPPQPVKPNVAPPAATGIQPLPLRDPFAVPAGYDSSGTNQTTTQAIAASNQAMSAPSFNASTSSPLLSRSDRTNSAPVHTGFALRGVMKSGQDKVAVVEYDGSSQSVGLYEKIRGYQVVSIGEDSIRLAGPSGTQILRLQ